MIRNTSPVGYLRQYVRPYRWALVVAVLLAAILGPLEAAVPILVGTVFDSLLGGTGEFPLDIPLLGDFAMPSGSGSWLLVLMLLTILFKVIAGYGSLAATAYVGNSVVRDLRSDLYRSIISQPLGFFSGHHTGELMSRVSSDVGAIQNAVSNTLAELFKYVAILISLFAVIVYIDWRLSQMALVLLTLVFYPAVVFGRRLRRLGLRTQDEMAGMASILSETFTGNRIVKIFNMEGVEQAKFAESAKRVFRLGMRARLTAALSSPLMELLGVCVLVVFLVYAQNEIQAGRMTGGLFLAFVLALMKLYEPVRRISSINISFQRAIGASEKLLAIMREPGEVDSGDRELREFRHAVRFEDVRFSYQRGEPAVLDGVSFSLKRGEMLAVVGSSGAGKTSLANLLPRFYDVSAGRITIDGVDIRDLRLHSLRDKIAMVTQDVILFNETVRTNISYGNSDASEDAIRAAAGAALVHDFVSTLPDGYETIIGERGVRLSGGERQRISIARAILKDAPILILDEATSSLDAESEALVQAALQNLIAGRTTIVIAHRLSTVRRADRILVLSDGQIREEGMHEELILKRGLYWKLHQLQFEDVTP